MRHVLLRPSFVRSVPNMGATTGIRRRAKSVRNGAARKLDQAIKAGGGNAALKTVNGEELTFSENGPHNIVVTDASGHTVDISTYDVIQSNGVIMVVDKVLMPK